MSVKILMEQRHWLVQQEMVFEFDFQFDFEFDLELDFD